ncbi:tubulin-specific chaperone C [Eublepharis macularius]|uniref:Tubulin-specific chaperone C n=1 Tax=Eublepharis macularius TaxID=481883 RepID=A0AA97L0H2_EUBMA|nr:tubulin-specific chaperone C [Eublepharis macularius]
MKAQSEAKMEAVSEAEAERFSLAATTIPPLVPERLQQRQAERREDAERRRRERSAQAVQEEQSDFFTTAFAQEREAVEALLEPASDEAAAAGRLEEAAGRLQSLQRLLTDSVRFLAPYEVRQAQATVARLQGALSERRLQVQPKKRFAFRALKKEAAAAREPPKTSARPQASSGAALPCSSEPSADPECGFSQAEGKDLELGPAELLQRNVALSQLSRCRVRLRGNPNTLVVRCCRDCTLLCGPVSTSVLMEDCSGCLVALACQQLRTHHTTQSSFYVQVTSRAILEDCSGVRFAPYTWNYAGIEADFETSGLDRSRDNWSQVDDFNWLARDEPSPNWSVIPEEERIFSWN